MGGEAGDADATPLTPSDLPCCRAPWVTMISTQSVPSSPSKASFMTAPSDAPTPQPDSDAVGHEPGGGEPSTGAERAAQLLTAPKALSQLSLQEARVVVNYMVPAHFSEGTCFIREGDSADTGFMALVIRGEVIVENIIVSRTQPVTIAVLEPGSLIGEMGLLDSGPRSASCTAGTELFCAILTRNALQSLIAQDPAIGAKLLLAVSARIAERLRDTARKLRLYAKLAMAMQLEIDRIVRETPRSPGV